jgi:hypothetical protein
MGKAEGRRQNEERSKEKVKGRRTENPKRETQNSQLKQWGLNQFLIKKHFSSCSVRHSVLVNQDE